MNKPRIVDRKLKELARANNRHLRNYLRRGDRSELERIELNRITMRKYLALA